MGVGVGAMFGCLQCLLSDPRLLKPRNPDVTRNEDQVGALQ